MQLGILPNQRLDPLQRRGRVQSALDLMLCVWGERNGDDTAPVRSFVRKLRNKLGDSPTRAVYIFNERGVGYRMARPDET